ncbi:MAG: NAD(P)H-binding protein [Candidatus Solibacter sp.]
MANVFITGATGFMGRRLAAELLVRGHRVRGLARAGSESRVAIGSEITSGDPLYAASYADAVTGFDTLVHLVGVAHPSPAKKEQFVSIDLASALQAVDAAKRAGVRHMVYVSVAHPAPVMRDYIAARSAAEAAIGASGMRASILRPWYVLGPGRRWPLAIVPVYWLMEALPSTREAARRLGMVSAEQMIAALSGAVEDPADGVRVWEVPEIRGVSTRATTVRSVPAVPLR